MGFAWVLGVAALCFDTGTLEMALLVSIWAEIGGSCLSSFVAVAVEFSVTTDFGRSAWLDNASVGSAIALYVVVIDDKVPLTAWVPFVLQSPSCLLEIHHLILDGCMAPLGLRYWFLEDDGMPMPDENLLHSHCG